MERNSVILSKVEWFATSWASEEVKAFFADLQKQIISFANPDTRFIQSPNHDFLMSSLLSVVSVTGFYLVGVFLLTKFVQHLFPEEDKTQSQRLSKKEQVANGSTKAQGRKELVPVSEKFRREPVLILAAVYNVAQVVLCTYMAARALTTAYGAGYSLFCNKFDLAADDMAKVHWVFYMSKILDFGDTFFIIVRRKWRQLSFLHVYHHASILMVSWLFQRTAFDGDTYYAIFANSSIHAIMYFYYFLRTFNVKVPAVIKMMVTNMQIIQFITMLSQAVYNYCLDCPFPTRLLLFYFFYICTMLFLFMDFANANYGKSVLSAKTAAAAEKKNA